LLPSHCALLPPSLSLSLLSQVSTIAHGVVGLFIGAVLRIPRLGSEGIKQLAADADHLCAVLSALGAGLDSVVPGADVTPIALLRDVQEALSGGAAELRKRLSAQKEKTLATECVRAVARLMRVVVP
jgi:hypothetical protein